MVRPPSDIWKHFNTIKNNGKNVATCKYCNAKYAFPNATRMTDHIVAKCKKCPADIKEKFTKNTHETSSVSNHNLSAVFVPPSESSVDDKRDASGSSCTDRVAYVSNSTISNEEFMPKNKKICNSRITLPKFIDSITKQESSKTDEHIARALYASDAPLSFFNTDYWKTAFKSLRPAYNLPSPYVFSSSLLDNEYIRTKELVENKIDRSFSLSLLSDGWTNVRGEGVINFIVCTPRPVFYKSINPGIERETGQFISDKLSEIIEEIGSAKFFLIVTDNASNMRSAWEKVMVKYPHISCVGCVAHCLNLLLKDFMKLSEILNASKKSRQICKHFKNHHVLYATFKSIQLEKYKKNKITSLKVPAETRFGSIFLNLNSLWKNKEAVQCTVIKEELKEEIKQDLKKTILDDNFWIKVNSIVKIMSPVLTGIKILESDRALLSEVPVVFKFIRDALDNLELSTTVANSLETFVNERYQFSCYPIHYAAHLLDPRFHGKYLKDDEILTAIEFISEKAGQLGLDKGLVIANVAQYRTKTGFWSRTSLWDCVNQTHPVIWWQGLCTTQALTPIASRILSGVPSSAACERNWSAHSNIHTIKRNRLATEKV